MDIFDLLVSYDRYKYKIDNGFIYPLENIIIDIILDNNISDNKACELILNLRRRIKND